MNKGSVAACVAGINLRQNVANGYADVAHMDWWLQRYIQHLMQSVSGSDLWGTISLELRTQPPPHHPFPLLADAPATVKNLITCPCVFRLPKSNPAIEDSSCKCARARVFVFIVVR